MGNVPALARRESEKTLNYFKKSVHKAGYRNPNLPITGEPDETDDLVHVPACGFLAVLATAQKRPPNYSLDDMPDTSFDCSNKIIGGYYADPETDCQMFHLQDFRFLCPNETSFDQENQICANWFDIDCEATTLYYSDNFDLYRIGYSPVKTSSFSASSPTPIPLGPSTARPSLRASASPALRQRPRPQTRPAEEEEEYFLQRSETGDRRLQQKDLRSSGSGNFFGKDKGKEDDYETENYPRKPVKKVITTTTTTTSVPATFVDQSFDSAPTVNKKKVAVRKLRKRPQQQQDYNNVAAQDSGSFQYNSPSTAAPAYNQPQTYNNNNYNDGQKSYDTSSSFAGSNGNYFSSTVSPSTSNYNVYTQRYNTIQRVNPTSSSTTQTPTSSAARNNYNYDNYQQTNNNQNNYNANNNYYNTNAALSSTTVKSFESSTTLAPKVNNNYNNYQTPQRRVPEYSTTSSTQAPNIYYNNQNQQRGRSSYNNEASSTTNYQTTANYQKINNDYTYNDNKFNQKGNTEYSSTAYPSTYDQYNNNYQRKTGNSYNQGNTGNVSKTTLNYPSATSTTTKAPSYDYKYQPTSSEEFTKYKSDNFDYQKRTTQVQASYNANFQTDADKIEGESLKTAPSNNYRPSSFNTYQNTYDSKTNTNNNYNAFNNTNNNYYNSNAAPKSSTYSSTEQSSTFNNKQTTKAFTNNNNYYTQTTVATPRAFAVVYSTTKQPEVAGSTSSRQSSAAVPFTSRGSSVNAAASKTTSGVGGFNSQDSLKVVANAAAPAYEVPAAKVHVSKRPETVGKPASSTQNLKDVSYDYAYYDDVNSEYDGVDPISDHHFGKGKESLKVARSAQR
uniref:Chitin-binding type-2 domain-containing protein n=1 Tax=Timema poppense TaxID=170557 RepID=A0A7R9GVW5_TIMPO|nr:unnamed protein product [Timema poppensis]